ncbi:hypothetical protein [Azohydromonas lata]|uniref:hypothetical protein n=1 Tax=Azohydromonas lata TaxID=45677 RepID=UPI0012F4A5F2|nr:hypothetical protein [Azohydromonas lata]
MATVMFIGRMAGLDLAVHAEAAVRRSPRHQPFVRVLVERRCGQQVTAAIRLIACGYR